MNDIFENTETMKENEHPRFYTAESVMRGHPDKLCDLIADSVLDACLQYDPASRVACEVMATHGHIIVAGEITTSAKPDVFNIVRDTLRDVGYDPKAYQIDCYIHDQSPDIAGAVEPELAEGEDEDTLGAGDQGVMVGYACNETPEYLPMPVVAAQRLVTLLEISRMTGVIPDIGPDGKVQVTMEYNGDTPVRITTVVVSVQHKKDTDAGCGLFQTRGYPHRWRKYARRGSKIQISQAERGTHPVCSGLSQGQPAPHPKHQAILTGGALQCAADDRKLLCRTDRPRFVWQKPR